MDSNGKDNKSNGHVDVKNHPNSHVDGTENPSKVCQNDGNHNNGHKSDCVKQCLDSETGNGVKKNNDLLDMARTKAFRWCRESLGGAWSKLQSENEIVVDVVSGGTSNYLYLISLPADVVKISSEPSEVLLRIYGEMSKSTMDFLIHDSVVFVLLAEKRLGPRPFAMYHDGRIEEFIKAAPIPPNDLKRPDVMTLVATKMAIFHSLNMPLSKKPTWFKTVGGWLKEAMDNFSSCSHIINALKKIAPPSFDILTEYDKLLTIQKDLNAPIVFSHNDLQGGNLLLAPDGSPAKDKMTVIDWEYASYNYRGFDFGNHFNEWMYDYTNAEYTYPEGPGYQHIPGNFPSKEQQYEFFTIYLTAQQEEVTEESLYALYKEANTLSMHSHFLWGVWSIIQAYTSTIEFEYAPYALNRFTEYFKQMERLPALLERKS